MPVFDRDKAWRGKESVDPRGQALLDQFLEQERQKMDNTLTYEELIVIRGTAKLCLSQSEIAILLGVCQRRVERLYRRAKAKLRKMIER
jgi:DNA-directed RNA polymerase specialized sigma subunit